MEFRRGLFRSDICFLFFFNDTATTEIYTLSLHDALPIFPGIAINSEGDWLPEGTDFTGRRRFKAYLRRIREVNLHPDWDLIITAELIARAGVSVGDYS